jgi:L-amino acid N-acyltransferase YncA
MPTIRLAEERDFPAITAIMKWATEETLATFTIHPRDEAFFRAKWEKTRQFYPWLVATEGDQVLGFAKAGSFRDNDAYSHCAEVSVYLAPANQRRGIGAKLYERLFALLHLQGFHQLIAIVTSANEDSIRFHERIGMKRVGAIADCGWKFDRFLGITILELRIQDAHQKPGQILTVAEVAANL